MFTFKSYVLLENIHKIEKIFKSISCGFKKKGLISPYIFPRFSLQLSMRTACIIFVFYELYTISTTDGLKGGISVQHLYSAMSSPLPPHVDTDLDLVHNKWSSFSHYIFTFLPPICAWL